MKMIKFLLPTFILGVLMMAPITASAQRGAPSIAPSRQFGIGVFGGGTVTGAGLSGQYAFSPSVILGLGVGFGGEGDSNSSKLDISEDLFGRFLFEGIVNPFAQVGFRNFNSSTSSTVGNTTTTTSGGYNSLYLGFGLQYFFNHNAGVYSMFELVTLDLSSNTHGQNTLYGVRNGRIGLEWYFD